MTVFEIAKKYYPRLWGKNRIDALHDAGKLTDEEYTEILAADGVTVQALGYKAAVSDTTAYMQEV